jgi:hypothetical protein
MNTKIHSQFRPSRFIAVCLIGLPLAAFLLSGPMLHASWPTNAAVEMTFSEGTGTSTTNSGYLGGLATLDPGTTINGFPGFSNLVPVGAYAPAGNAYALNMGLIDTVGGGRALDLTTVNGPSGTLGAFSQLTICGWLNANDLNIGSGGNRIASALETPGGLGFDLVQRYSGSLSLIINQYNDSSPNSSYNMIGIDANTAATNWTFFAVTYDSSLGSGQVKYYFGRANKLAGFDIARTYTGAVLSPPLTTGIIDYTGILTVGNFGSGEAARGATGTGSRTYRGLIDQLRIYTNAMNIDEIQQAQLEGPVTPVAATILRQPAGVTLLAGQYPTFTVDANGSGLVTYQWRTNGVAVPGATNSTFIMDPVTTNDTYKLISVYVDNALTPDPGVLSSNAVLVVIPPPPPGTPIYATADVFVEGNVNDPNLETSRSTYNAVSQGQINYGLAAAGGTSIGRRRSYLQFTLGTNEVSSAKFKIYNYWGGPSVNGQGRPASATVRILGTAVATPVTFTETTPGAIVSDFVPPAETNFVTIVTSAAGAVTNIGWYEFDITGWYNARLGQTTTLLLRSSATGGFDFPLYEDREGTAFTAGAGGTIANSGPRIEYFLAPPRFREGSISGGNVTMSGYYGPPGTNYVLLYSTDAALPLSSWTRVLTNQFDSAGKFSVTRPFNSGSSGNFYRLLLP